MKGLRRRQAKAQPHLWVMMVLVSIQATATFLLGGGIMVVAVEAASSRPSLPCQDQCQNGGECVPGEASFSDHPRPDGAPLAIHEQTSLEVATNGDGAAHCRCPPGWTGVKCDIVFDTCSDTHKCYHGGACIPGLIDTYGNEQQFCDCTNALDDHGYAYVGKYCEHQSVNYCDPDGTTFCTNGGECNPEYPHYGPPCLCPNGYEGDSCQYKENTVVSCDLKCENGGHCVLGEATKEERNKNDPKYWNGKDENLSDFQHCACPPGYAGPDCSIRREVCGDSHHCYHGSTCVEKIGSDGTAHHHCDCTTASNAKTTSHAGRYCQYEATSYCTKNTIASSHSHLFCVNDGICNTEHLYEGCICPSGFTGFSCEFIATTTTTNTTTTTTTETNPSSSQQQQQQSPATAASAPGAQTTAAAASSTLPEHVIFDDALEDTEPMPEEDEASPVEEGHVVVLDNTNTNEQASSQVHAADDPNYYQCDDNICQNGGICRKGAKELGTVTSQLDSNIPSLQQTSNENFEHCVCPPTHTGLFCEHVVEICGQGEHLCLHGSNCVKDGEDYKCDCSAASGTNNATTTAFAGKSCEHASSDICTQGDLGPGKPLSFCVHGTCKTTVTPEDPHPGCDCPAGWTGPHCELKDTAAAANAATTTTSCPNGWTGPDCMIPDEIHGQAVPAETNGYNGEGCPRGWTGPDCDIPLPDRIQDNNNDGGDDDDDDDDDGVASSALPSETLALEVFLLVFSLVLVALIILLGMTLFVQRRRRKRAELVESVQFLNQTHGGDDVYSDEPNISPHRDAMLDPFPSRVHSSSSDPFASRAVPVGEPTRQVSKSSSSSHHRHRIPPSPTNYNDDDDDDDDDDRASASDSGNMQPVEIC